MPSRNTALGRPHPRNRSKPPVVARNHNLALTLPASQRARATFGPPLRLLFPTGRLARLAMRFAMILAANRMPTFGAVLFLLVAWWEPTTWWKSIPVSAATARRAAFIAWKALEEEKALRASSSS